MTHDTKHEKKHIRNYNQQQGLLPHLVKMGQKKVTEKCLWLISLISQKNITET